MSFPCERYGLASASAERGERRGQKEERERREDKREPREKPMRAYAHGETGEEGRTRRVHSKQADHPTLAKPRLLCFSFLFNAFLCLYR